MNKMNGFKGKVNVYMNKTTGVKVIGQPYTDSCRSNDVYKYDPNYVLLETADIELSVPLNTQFFFPLGTAVKWVDHSPHVNYGYPKTHIGIVTDIDTEHEVYAVEEDKFTHYFRFKEQDRLEVYNGKLPDWV